jgi:hypothetical protein
MAAVGFTVDEAGAAARYARALDTPGGVPLQSIENANDWLLAQARESEALRSRFVRSLSAEGADGLLRRSAGPLSERIPSESVFELVRKVDFSNIEEGLVALGGKVRNRFGIELTTEQLRDLRDYAQSVDAFSVGLLIPERISNDLSPAAHGIVSADFAGQGGRNLAETAEALARSVPDDVHSDISSVVTEARRAEIRATQLMRRLNDDFRDALARTVGRDAVRRLTFSGDDGIFLPEAEWTHADRVALTSNLAEASSSPSSFRLTWVPTVYGDGAVIPSEIRSRLVYQAETVEKSIRSALEARVPREQLSQTLILVEYVPDATGGGSYRLILSSSESGSLRNAAARESLVDAAEQELERHVRSDASGRVRADGVEYASPRRDVRPGAREGGRLEQFHSRERVLRSASRWKKMPVAYQPFSRLI